MRGSPALVAVLALVLGLAGCDRNTPDAARPLLVLAASDLAPAFEELVPAFEARTGQPVDVVLGSTGNLASQIRHGAPADLFFAADEAFLDDLVERGRIDPETRRLYAVGRIVLVAPPGRPPPERLQELTGLPSVAIANPEHAPYGRAARQALESAGVWEAVQARLVFGENIAHTLRFVETGNVDAAIVALSLVEGRHPYRLVDAAHHQPLVQAAGVTAGSRNPRAAREFLDFVLSREGQVLLGRYGFEPPPEHAATGGTR